MYCNHSCHGITMAFNWRIGCDKKTTYISKYILKFLTNKFYVDNGA